MLTSYGGKNTLHPQNQKITRQMLCDKCSKNDVTLIPQNIDVLWREDPQNADVTSAARWGGTSTIYNTIRIFVIYYHVIKLI
jgi:hypothetical protein